MKKINNLIKKHENKIYCITYNNYINSFYFYIQLENSISKLKKKIIEMENNNKNISCEYNIVIDNNIQ